MGFFECCHYCKAPKRHPGCHCECPEYTEQKKLWEEYKEKERIAKLMEPKPSSAQLRAIRRNMRSNRKQY